MKENLMESNQFTLCSVFILLILKQTTAVQPSKIILGLSSGLMITCQFKQFDNCTTLNTAESTINSLVVYGEFIYAGLNSGVMWRCVLHKSNSCSVINTVSHPIKSLTISGDYIYAGLESGFILRCLIDVSNSCSVIHTANSSINALVVDAKSTFIGLGSGVVKSCIADFSNYCEIIYKSNSEINTLALSGENIYLGLKSGVLITCSKSVINSCMEMFFVDSEINSLDVFGEYLLGGLSSGYILRCKLHAKVVCEILKTGLENIVSVETVYSTVDLINIYKGEDKACTWQPHTRCAPFIIYYDIKQRSSLEIHIENGKLLTSQGVLFDTRKADLSHTGFRAIFAMEPGGRIYASNQHPLFLLHHSSFVDGSPVSAAGELQVEEGLIKSITSCSGHYRPSYNIALQVIPSLKSKGYKRDVTVSDCSKMHLLLDLYYNLTRLISADVLDRNLP